MLGYADDFDIAVKLKRALREAFVALKADEAKKLALAINVTNTKYMRVEGGGAIMGSFEVWPYKFEKVESFVYLGIEANVGNGTSQEVNRSISAANWCYFGLVKHFKLSMYVCMCKAL